MSPARNDIPSSCRRALAAAEEALTPYATPKVRFPFNERAGDIQIALASVRAARASFDVITREELDTTLFSALIPLSHAVRENGRGDSFWYANGAGAAAYFAVLEAIGALRRSVTIPSATRRRGAALAGR